MGFFGYDQACSHSGGYSSRVITISTTSGAENWHGRYCTCGHCGHRHVIEFVSYVTPTNENLNYKQLGDALSEIRRQRVVASCRQIALIANSKVLSRPQLPRGFNPLSPLARSNC